MTGVADMYMFLSNQITPDVWKQNLMSMFNVQSHNTKFVVLSWKHTGFELLHDILNSHPEIVMHQELFNKNDILTTHPAILNLSLDCSNTRHVSETKWAALSRDLNTTTFLNYVWRGKLADGSAIKNGTKSVGFVLLPDHCQRSSTRWALDDQSDVKKIVFWREDEVSVFVSMLRNSLSTRFSETSRSSKSAVYVKPQLLQEFIDNYRDLFRNLCTSERNVKNTFCLTYEQIVNRTEFKDTTLTNLCRFLKVKPDLGGGLIDEIVRSSVDENLEKIIENYDDVEFAFRHTDARLPIRDNDNTCSTLLLSRRNENENIVRENILLRKQRSWSILLPICSKVGPNFTHGKESMDHLQGSETTKFSVEYFTKCRERRRTAWKRLEEFAESLSETANNVELRNTECIVGIDDDDPIFGSKKSIERVKGLLPTSCIIVRIPMELYGKVCKIWNLLANHARNDYLTLLGDDVYLINIGWQRRIDIQFEKIAKREGLPFGAACVAFNDVTFPGFPTFPVIHRWHMDHFSDLLPSQFVNQGGDPFLFELYKRWNASTIVEDTRLENTVGGDSEARYDKHSINWTTSILQSSIQKLQKNLMNRKAKGICVDVVVPSFRIQNECILSQILSLRASVYIYVKFWIVVDNKCEQNLKAIQDLATSFNSKSKDGNYFVTVVFYGENRGASFARNTGYNSSFADWVLFLDDDVIPDKNLLDAYVGAILRYPTAKIFVGMSAMPPPFNFWTRILEVSKVNHFFSIAKYHQHPPWGVTANLLVCGSRFNQTVQFKSKYPKTGGGEDVDFIFQLKHYHGETKKDRKKMVVAVPGAKVSHPWWRSGGVCYGQICGWARGDSLCLTEWPEKTFVVCPNWIETIFIAAILTPILGWNWRRLLGSSFTIVVVEHILKSLELYMTRSSTERNSLERILLILGGSTIVSAQEAVRFGMCLCRLSLFSFCRRLDWFDGEAREAVLTDKHRSLVKLLLMVGIFALFHYLI